MTEEDPDKLLSRLGGMLEYFRASPGDTGSRFGTAEEVQEIQPEPAEIPAEPEPQMGALETLGGQEMTERSSDTLEAARSALDNYRNTRGNPGYGEDLV
tara:strand:- start:2411 stop:2707 length:297 start_codon:yes stop_codon:yes gene_type:complete